MSLYDRMMAEAEESVRRKAAARATGATLGSRQRDHGDLTRFSHDVEARRTNRDPCFGCGVRRDVHDALGCKRWRGG